MGGERARKLLGTIVGERYALESMIADGATSTVFDARDVKTKQRFAVKVVFDAGTARLARETRGVHVIHPNVCTVVDVRSAADFAYVVMERLAGETLAQRIATRGSLPAAEAVDVFAQLLGALTAVHDAGLVHGDVKPANVFLVARHGCPPFVKLLDFGSSLSTKDDGVAEGWSGSPAYMAPEQARRDPRIDARADVYSTGITLFEALTGARPFANRDFRHLLSPREDALPEIPALFDDVVRRACAHDRHERYGSAREMQASLYARPRSDTSRSSGMRRRISDRELEAQRPPKTKR